MAAVAEWYRYQTVACLVPSSSPVPLKTLRIGQRCTLNLSRDQTSSVCNTRAVEDGPRTFSCWRQLPHPANRRTLSFDGFIVHQPYYTADLQEAQDSKSRLDNVSHVLANRTTRLQRALGEGFAF
ncbi:hypothetical protein TNCV_306071 [Trichonephila clavipes]|nr:hypothetical protein TNCV_306071 [Trichonephila clavipes]